MVGASFRTLLVVAMSTLTTCTLAGVSLRDERILHSRGLRCISMPHAKVPFPCFYRPMPHKLPRSRAQCRLQNSPGNSLHLRAEDHAQLTACDQVRILLSKADTCLLLCLTSCTKRCFLNLNTIAETLSRSIAPLHPQCASYWPQSRQP